VELPLVSFDVAIGEGKKTEGKVTRLIHATLCLLSMPSTAYGRANGSIF
jgi:hypothetical protein